MTRPDRSFRRLVLIDFDWRDADLLPRLMHAPGVAIRLVAGAGRDDAGVRLAALCGLPRTLELADLTREIFDLALVGERSPRRESLDRLLRALGTPTAAPQAFDPLGRVAERRVPDVTPLPDAATSRPSPLTDDWILAPDVRPGSHGGATASSRLAAAVEESRTSQATGRTLLGPEAFSARLQSAIERHRSEGFDFALYRMTFDGPDAALAGLVRDLPAQLRDTDCICHPAPQELLLLCAGAAEAFAHVRGRVEALWRWGWRANAGPGEPPEIVDERVDLALATDCGTERP